MMAFGVGSYRVTDYFRFGLPMNLLVFVLSMLIIPRVWPF